MILHSIETPADIKGLNQRATRRIVRGDQGVHRRHGDHHRRPPGLEPGRRRAHPGPAPGVRLAPRRHPVGHRPPGLRAQAADRPPLRLQDPQAGRRHVGLPEPGRVRARLDREQPRLDGALLRARHRQRVHAARHRRRAPGGRRGRRRRAHRRHGLRGPQQPRATRGRRVVIVLNDNGRSYAPDGVAAVAEPDHAAAQPDLHRGPRAPAPAPARAPGAWASWPTRACTR